MPIFMGLIGYTGSITELDMWILDNTTFSLRFQAAAYGDYFDACLFSPNCIQLRELFSHLNGFIC